MERVDFWLVLFALVAGYGLLLGLVFQVLRAIGRVMRAVVMNQPAELRPAYVRKREAA